MMLKQRIFEFRMLIADFRVCDAFVKERPTPIEFHKSAIKNHKSAMQCQSFEVA